METTKKPNTYAEEKGRPAFDWYAFLENALAADTYWAKAKGLSTSWVTCACGNQCAVLPRNWGGAPEDYQLRRLGMDFMEAIGDENPFTALDILDAIEARSAYLLAQLGKEAPCS